MNTPTTPTCIRHYRDICKGRDRHQDPENSFADIRYQLRSAYPPFTGERIRRATLGTMIAMVTALTTFCCLSVY